MRDFMDYVRGAFYDATGWNRESSYSSLNSTADALLNFPTPVGLRLTLSSLASPNFATSYQLGTVGVVDGSISYLYSSVPLRAHLTPQSDRLPLSALIQSYRHLPELPRRDDLSPYPLLSTESASLLYGRLYLPKSLLEALVIKRVSPALQLELSSVSGQHLRNGGTVLGVAQYDVGRYALEGLASSDGGLLGLRGVYNFGGDTEDILPISPSAVLGSAARVRNGKSCSTNNTASDGGSSVPDELKERIYGRFSTGGEIYYGTLNKSGGMSLGARFATLPTHRGTPLTATMTLNPLMGNISATYAVMAGWNCSLATKFGFNVYSYESDWAIGMELWRKRVVKDPIDPVVSAEKFLDDRSFRAKMEWRLDEPPPELSPATKDREESAADLQQHGHREVVADTTGLPQERTFQAKLEWRLNDPGKDRQGGSFDSASASGEPGRTSGAASTPPDDEFSGVIKARLDQNMRIGILWEGRAKSLIFSLGSGIDLRNLDSPFRTLGVEIQFSS